MDVIFNNVIEPRNVSGRSDLTAQLAKTEVTHASAMGTMDSP